MSHVVRTTYLPHALFHFAPEEICELDSNPAGAIDSIIP
jgi:hypothetical protein